MVPWRVSSIFMLPANCSLHSSIRNYRILLPAMLLAATCLLGARRCVAQEPATSGETIPVDQVQPGMQGYAYTIFAGDQVEKFDLEVIGVMPNFLGPKQSIILVQLKGPKVEHTGVVAGMSGSPGIYQWTVGGRAFIEAGDFHQGTDRRSDADCGRTGGWRSFGGQRGKSIRRARCLANLRAGRECRAEQNCAPSKRR